MTSLRIGQSIVAKTEISQRLSIAFKAGFAELLEVPGQDLEELVWYQIERFKLFKGKRPRNPDLEKLFAFKAGIASNPKTLNEKLTEQLPGSGLDTRQLNIAKTAVLPNINIFGRLTKSCSDIAKARNEYKSDDEVDESEVEEVLSHIQRFEPAGVGARSGEECLLLQIARGQVKDAGELRTLLDEHLGALAVKNYKQIAESMDISVKHVEELLKTFVTLELNPGRDYGASADHLVIDVIVEEKSGNSNSGFDVRLADDDIDGASWYSETEGNGPSNALLIAEAKHFGDWIELRRQVILGVATEIVNRQPEFLDAGNEALLKPMTQQDVADALKIDRSTVSRAIRHHYMDTPCGTFEMSKFFVGGFPTAQGEGVSVEHLKEKVMALIEAKDEQEIFLSDEGIARELKDEGIKIKPRTVNKYRREMDIPNSRERKVRATREDAQ